MAKAPFKKNNNQKGLKKSNNSISSEVTIDVENKLLTGEKPEGILNQFLYNNVLSFVVFALIIIGSAYFVYNSALQNEPVYCDDNIFLYDYEPINSKDNAIEESFKKTFGTTYYRPMLNVSFVLDYRMGREAEPPSGGTNPYYYLRSNLVMHIIGSVFVFAFFIILGFDRLKSFIFAMIFTVHPILTPAVSWISGRNDMMITMFILISFVSFIAYYQSRHSILKWVWLLAHIASYLLALYTKEVAVMVPIIAVAYVWLYKKEKVFTFSNIVVSIGWIIAFLYFYMMRAEAIEGINNPDTIGLEAFFVNYPTIFTLIGKLFIPHKMIALATFEAFSIIVGIIATVGIGFAIYKFGGERKNKALFGITWFVAFLFPSLMIRILYVDDFFDYAEHRAYLPMIGIFIVFLEILRAQKIDFRKPIYIGISVLVIGAFAYRAMDYKEAFDGRKNFWGHMTHIYPDVSRGYLDLGKAFLVNKEYKRAEELYQRGMELNNQNANFYVDLCVLYMQQKEYEKAVSYGQRAVELRPKDRIANFNYGSALVNVNKFKEAIPYLLAAANKSNNIQWFGRLGYAAFKAEDWDMAIKAYNAGLQLNPNDPSMNKFLSVAYARKQMINESEQYMIRVMQLAPTDSENLSNLVALYIQLNTPEQLKKIPSVVQFAKKNGASFSPQITARLQKAGYL